MDPLDELLEVSTPIEAEKPTIQDTSGDSFLDELLSGEPSNTNQATPTTPSYLDAPGATTGAPEPISEPIVFDPWLDAVIGAGELVYKGARETIGLGLGVVAGTTGVVSHLFDPIKTNTGAPIQKSAIFTEGLQQSQKEWQYNPKTVFGSAVDTGIKEGISKPLQQSATYVGRKGEAIGGPIGGALGETAVHGTAAILGFVVGKPIGNMVAKATDKVAGFIPRSSREVEVEERLDNPEEVPEIDPIKYDDASLRQALEFNAEFTRLNKEKLTTEFDKTKIEGIQQELLGLKDAAEKIKGQITKNKVAELSEVLQESVLLDKGPESSLEVPALNNQPLEELKLFISTAYVKVNSAGKTTVVYRPKEADLPGRLGDKTTKGSGIDAIKRTIGDAVGEAAKYIQPPKFLAEKHPVVNWGISKLSAYQKQSNNVVEEILYGSDTVPTKGSILTQTKRTPTDRGGITNYQALSTPEKTQLLGLMFSRAMYNKSASVSKIDLEQHGLNNNQIDAYTNLLKGKDRATYFANNMILRYGGAKAKPINTGQNFMPHAFFGNFRVSVQSGTKTHYLPAASHAEATKLIKAIQTDNPHLRNITIAPARNYDQDIPIRLFSEVQLFDKVPPHLQEIFFAHNKTNSRVDPEIFLKGYSAWVEGAVKYGQNLRMKHEMKALYEDKEIKEFYPNAVHVVKQYQDSVTFKKGWTEKFVDQMVSRYIGENKINQMFTAGNKWVSTLYLFAFNMKFIAQQAIQPYHMAPAALYKAAAVQGLPKGGVLKAMVDAHRAFIKPTPDEVDAIKHAISQGTIQPKFVNALMGDNFFDYGVHTKAEMWRDKITGRSLGAAADVWSRTLENLMFYKYLTNQGVKHDIAKERAAVMTDMHMVEYHSSERPILISKRGPLGQLASPIGTFKSFPFNYLSQLSSYVRLARKDQSYKPLAAFLATQALVGGLKGAILVAEADFILETLGYPGLSDLFIESGMPEAVVYGVPTAATEMDLATGTRAASVLPRDLLSNPLFEYSADIASAVYNYGTKLYAGTVSPLDAMKLELLVAPKSFHGLIEAYYTQKGLSPTIDPKRGAGTVRREFKDWAGRFMATRSLEESKILRAAWSLQKMKASDRLTKESIVTLAAWNLNNGLDIPDWLFDKALDPKEALFKNSRELTQAIIKKTSNLNTTILERIEAFGHTPQGQKQLEKLRRTGIESFD